MAAVDTQTPRAQAIIREAYADALVQQKLSEDGRVSLCCEEIAERLGESPQYVDAVLAAVFESSRGRGLVERIEANEE